MRLAAAVAALFGLALVAQPVYANEEAYAFIESVYASYEEGDGNGIPLEGPTLRDHFTDELATLIEEDAKLGDQKRMNYDPLADAEEWEISDIRITIRELTYDHVLASVNFYSYLESRLVNVDLVKTRNGWRIDDVQVPDGRLRELFADDPDAGDEDDVAADGGPSTTESIPASENRASTMTAPVTPPIHFSGNAVPQPRPAAVRAEPAPAVVEPAALEHGPEAAPVEPAGDIPAALETAAAPAEAPPSARPEIPVRLPAEAIVPETSVPADESAAPAAVPAGPAPEPAAPAEPARPVEAAPPPPDVPAIVAPDAARKAAKPPEKEKPRKKAVAPKKGKPKQAAKPRTPPPAAAPAPPAAAAKPPVPPASGAPRFSVTRVPPPPAVKPAKPPVQAATEKVAPRGEANKARESLP